MNVGTPAIERSKEIIIFEEGKSNLKLLDGAINEVLQEGDGSSRKVALKINYGSYIITNRTMKFVMTTSQGIIAPDIQKEEDGLSVETIGAEITVYIEYDFDLEDKEFSKGIQSVFVKNDSGKISIS